MTNVARRRLQAGHDGVVDSAKNCLSPELLNKTTDSSSMSAEKSVSKSPSHESWLHHESADDASDGRPSQRRHYHQFNKSSIFEGPTEGTDSKEATPTKQPPIAQDQKEESSPESEFGQRRHYHDRNRTTFDF